MIEQVSKALSSSLKSIDQEENIPLAKTLVEKGKTIFAQSYDHLEKTEIRLMTSGFFTAAAKALDIEHIKQAMNLFLLSSLLGEERANQLGEEIGKFSDLIISMVKENKMSESMIPICIALAMELEETYGKD